ncbi:MAG TPA: hypothetical protein VKH35_08605 [Thermoanaerobaculia bacterium]|nr:hypothetical protein [Thermoanaerobaculia bacterium]
MNLEQPGAAATLSILCLGQVHAASFEPLAAHLTRIEQVVTTLAPQIELSAARAEVNRAIDAAAHDWILILRERETIDAPLAAEIAESMRRAGARGFRIRGQVFYAGKALRLGARAGELRLFHRRYLLRRGDIGVQGTVVRLRNALQSRTFESPAEHREFLRAHAVPHSGLRRLLLFLRNARTFDPNTLRYLWIEAAFDHTPA